MEVETIEQQSRVAYGWLVGWSVVGQYVVTGLAYVL